MQARSYSAASAPTSLHTGLLDPTAGWGASWLTALKPGKRARELSHARRDGRARGTERAGDVAARHPGPRGALACRLAVDAAARDGGAPQTGALRRRGGHRCRAQSPGPWRSALADRRPRRATPGRRGAGRRPLPRPRGGRPERRGGRGARQDRPARAPVPRRDGGRPGPRPAARRLRCARDDQHRRGASLSQGCAAARPRAGRRHRARPRPAGTPRGCRRARGERGPRAEAHATRVRVRDRRARAPARAARSRRAGLAPALPAPAGAAAACTGVPPGSASAATRPRPWSSSRPRASTAGSRPA